MNTVKLAYFSWIRERVGTASEDVLLPDDVSTIGDLLGWLKTRGEGFATALEYPDIVRVAIDHEHVDDRDFSVKGATEIALFPPMTGG